MRERVWFTVGLALGALFGVGATLVIVSAKPRREAAPVVVAQQEQDKSGLTWWPNYDATPIQTIRESLRGLSLPKREAVRVYEEAHLKRRGILSVLKALEEERVNGNA
jgi:hypothetical protein